MEYESIRDTAFGGKLETNVLKYEELVQAYVRKYCGEIYCLYQFLFEENGRALE